MHESTEQAAVKDRNYRAPNQSELPRSTAIKLVFSGHVQGVGFRPFVYRLAAEHGISGYVLNRLGEVEIVACGQPVALGRFRSDIVRRAPPLSQPTEDSYSSIDDAGFSDFRILASSADARARIFVPADHFMCDDCLRELRDPDDRRYRYPFTNCTQCGPRYTLINALPYDRPNTSMAGFPLCPECDREYRDPRNRRFHAEPVACPECGPQLSFREPGHESRETSEVALAAAIRRLRSGDIVAVKGIGGYHLLCDARSETAVGNLRQRKNRPAKPLAVMFPIDCEKDLDYLRDCVEPDRDEEALLRSPQRPIVLLRKKPDNDIADNVAPGLDELGVFLPYSPLHQLILDDFGGPLVATSGNISGEPVLTENGEAEERLSGVADAFLHHDRPIVRPADDSVYRKISGQMRPLRIGRGSSPVEIKLPWRQEEPLLAVGGHMKGTVTLSWEGRAVISPHIGEMDSPRSLAVFEQVTGDLQSLYGVKATRIVCDSHPGYTTHRWARQQSIRTEGAWHHHAHASALVGEQESSATSGQSLVFTWDGTGLGEDGSLWGGEALLGKPGAWHRVASLKPFRLPGGDRAGREPWRSAAAIMWECGRAWNECPVDGELARTAWNRDLNCPRTSAMGRLFDAAAAIVMNLSQVSFEAEGPMLLESMCRMRRDPVHTTMYRKRNDVWRSDWTPLLSMLSDTSIGQERRAEIFHSSIAWLLLQQARTIRDDFSIDQVGLTGGVFQNRVLTEQAVELLKEDGFQVILPSRLPCNDAALSFGQAVEIAARGRQE